MSVDNPAADGPVPEHFFGSSMTRQLKRAWHATRPRFFPASVLPVLAGSAWGFMVALQFDVTVFALALLATVCVHAGANVLNDVGDDAGGTDRQNGNRVYPYTGGSRFIQAGIISARGMAGLGVTLLALAAIAGFWLLLARGVTVIWFGCAGMLLATLYSLGPMRLSAMGVGELSVGVAFGILPVAGAAWLQSGVIDLESIVFALPISAWVAAVLLANEVPDIDSDGATGKRTLAVRLGPQHTANLYLAIHVCAAGAVVLLSFISVLPRATAAAPAVLLLLAFKASGGIRRGIADRNGMTAAIESTLAIHTLGCVWLTGCALFVAFTTG